MDQENSALFVSRLEALHGLVLPAMDRMHLLSLLDAGHNDHFIPPVRVLGNKAVKDLRRLKLTLRTIDASNQKPADTLSTVEHVYREIFDRIGSEPLSEVLGIIDRHLAHKPAVFRKNMTLWNHLWWFAESYVAGGGRIGASNKHDGPFVRFVHALALQLNPKNPTLLMALGTNHGATISNYLKEMRKRGFGH